MYRLKKILLFLSRSYSPDVRALSLMRIGVALVVLADLCIRSGDLTAHYTDAGVWPTRLVHTLGWKPGYWTLHALSGSYGWALLLFGLHFLFAASLLLGYRTRLATVLTLVFTISLHNRNLYIQQAGDDLLRLTLFWGLFLPWQACYSLDAKQKRLPPAKRYGIAGAGYLLLLASVYFFTTSLKTSPEWHSEGSALYYALSLGQMRLPYTGDWLYAHPALMTALTHVVYYTELILPFLILYPSSKGRLRLLAFALIVLLHTGIGLTLYVGLFFVINMVTAIGLLPASIMDRLEKKTGRSIHTARSFLYSRRESSLAKISQTVFCGLAIFLCLIINLSSVQWFSYELRPEMNYTVNALRLDQYWGMFSPTILKKDGWFVYYGNDSIGRQWDLRRNEDYVDFAKPGHIVSMYRTDRWRKLAENMQGDNSTFLRPLYGSYILHKWNQEHPEKKITILNLYFMEERTLPGYRTTPVEKKLFCVSDDHPYTPGH